MKRLELIPGSTVDLFDDAMGMLPHKAQVVSIIDTGIVVTLSGNGEAPTLRADTPVRVVLTSAGRAAEATGIVAGRSEEGGVEVQLGSAVRPLERRGFPRAEACIPMRYERLDEKSEAKVTAAIHSRMHPRPGRPTEPPGDRSDLAAIYRRLHSIETTLELLADIVIRAGTGQPPTVERQVVLSASGMSFAPDDLVGFEIGTPIEVELLLPLGDPVRVRATARIIRFTTDVGDGSVAVRFEAVNEFERDEIGRYVFQLQRRQRLRSQS